MEQRCQAIIINDLNTKLKVKEEALKIAQTNWYNLKRKQDLIMEYIQDSKGLGSDGQSIKVLRNVVEHIEHIIKTI